MRVVMLTLIPISLLFFVGASPVADASADGQEFNGLDTLWIVLSAVLVFFMQAGFAMVEAGLVRSKNAANVLMKNLLDFSSATLGYFLFGYAIMYGSEGAFSGSEGWMLLGAESPIEGVPVEAFWFFQAVFAGAAATIVAGAVAERMRFVAYLCYSFVICALIYPLVGHWVWGGGWLAELKFHDFAGSAVVHTVGATAGLVGAMILGPRIGKFNKDGSANVIPGHNLSMVAIGAFILWFGWYGFNAGSTLGMGEPDVVARVVANTTLAPSIAAVTAMATAWKMFGKPDLTLALNGALAGLVAITAPCGFASMTPSERFPCTASAASGEPLPWASSARRHSAHRGTACSMVEASINSASRPWVSPPWSGSLRSPCGSSSASSSPSSACGSRARPSCEASM